MAGDRFSAVWLSHSSIRDYLKCPRAYYLKNIYKDPQTKHKIALMSPPLALGQAVHEVIEALASLPVEQRFLQSLTERYEKVWQRVRGRNGGFSSVEAEERYKARGWEMLHRVEQHPGPLANKALRMKEDLPHFWLSEEDNLILCGKIDWLEYVPQSDSVRVIDFKTSKQMEDADSLQLPIYLLLVHYTQSRPVSGLSYWYLEQSDDLVPMPLPDLVESQEKILKMGKQIKLARQLEKFRCPTDGCRECEPYEKVLRGEAEFIGTDSMRRDIYILPAPRQREEAEIF